MSSYLDCLDLIKQHNNSVDINSLAEVNLLRKINEDTMQPLFYNSTFNFYKDGIEIIKYKKDFPVIRQFNKDDFKACAESYGFAEEEIDKCFKQVNRDRILVKNEFGEFSVNRDKVSYFDVFDRVQYNVKVSRKRTLNNLYSYALSNKWRYFFTLTIDQNKYDSTDPNIINGYYKEFVRKLKRADSAASCLFVLEYHEDKEHLHLHGFVNADLSSFLTRAFNPNTNEPITDKLGNQIFNCSLWNYGFSTCAEFQKGYNKVRVANYLSKYISKDYIQGSLLPYGCKMLLHTRNLDSRISVNTKLTDIELCNLLISYYYDSAAAVKFDNFLISDISSLPVCKKSTDRFTVYFLSYNSVESS